MALMSNTDVAFHQWLQEFTFLDFRNKLKRPKIPFNYLVNAGHCGASVSELHNNLKKLLSLNKVKIDVANVICHLQYCVAVDNLLALSLKTSHACLCGLTVAEHAVFIARNVWCASACKCFCMCIILHVQIIYGLVSV